MTEVRSHSRTDSGDLPDLAYPELRKIAAAQLRHERADYFLQPTALVHEDDLHLSRNDFRTRENSRRSALICVARNSESKARSPLNRFPNLLPSLAIWVKSRI